MVVLLEMMVLVVVLLLHLDKTMVVQLQALEIQHLRITLPINLAAEAVALLVHLIHRQVLGLAGLVQLVDLRDIQVLAETEEMVQ
jgi:hypothetical protein